MKKKKTKGGHTPIGVQGKKQGVTLGELRRGVVGSKDKQKGGLGHRFKVSGEAHWGGVAGDRGMEMIPSDKGGIGCICRPETSIIGVGGSFASGRGRGLRERPLSDHCKKTIKQPTHGGGESRVPEYLENWKAVTFEGLEQEHQDPGKQALGGLYLQW